MDTKTLVIGPDVAFGERIASALASDASLRVRAVMWWLHELLGEFRLLIATPLFDSLGPIQAHVRINEALASANIDVPPGVIWVADHRHPIVEAIGLLIASTSKNYTIANLRLNELEVTYAYVYFVNDVPKRKAGTKRRRTN